MLASDGIEHLLKKSCLDYFKTKKIITSHLLNRHRFYLELSNFIH